MKIRNFRLVLSSLASKTVLVFTSLLIATALPIQIAQRVSADKYDDKITALQQDIDNAQAQADKLAVQANTYQNAIIQLQNQVAVIQAQIDISQAQYDKLIAQIADTEQKIKDNKNALGDTIASMYVDGNITPLEMLASSNSISDYLDKQEYQTSIRDQLTSTISEIKELKAQLDKQKIDVKAVLDRQQAEKASLAANQAQQQDLFNQTKGEEVAYQQMVASNKQRLADVAAQQRAYYQSLLNSGNNVTSGVSGDFIYENWSGNQGCSGGYPWDAEGSYGYRYGCAYNLDEGVGRGPGIDSWQLYNRECVSYAAWAIENRFNKHIHGFYGAGMPDQWIYNSSATRVYDPQPGDAVVLPPTSDGFAPVGHLMVVESASDGWIHVSQYNFYGTGEYSTMDIRNSGIILLRFQNN